MATLIFSVSDEILRKAQENMGLGGKEKLIQYLSAVVQVIAEGGIPIDDETEAALLEGLASPAEEMTEADWRRLMCLAEERWRTGR